MTTTLLDEAPSGAGMAKLAFENQGTPDTSLRPGLSNGTITFPGPFDRLKAFISLRDGEQFVAIEEGPEGRRVYFGGTDEKPFLVELELWLGEILEQEGPEAFYEALKPGLIRRLENAYRGSADYTRRQGDFWTFQLPFTWEELSHNTWVNGVWNLFGTRHILSGSYIRNPMLLKICGKILYAPPRHIAIGNLRAPDHLLLNLYGPCAIARTRGINGPHQSFHGRIGD